MTGKTAAVAAGLGIALVAVIVCLVLVLSYRGQVNGYRSQISTVDQQLAALRSEEQQAAKTASQANNARLGVCYSTQRDSVTYDINDVSLQPPVVSGGVYQCPSGMNFVSVVPVQG